MPVATSGTAGLSQVTNQAETESNQKMTLHQKVFSRRQKVETDAVDATSFQTFEAAAGNAVLPRA